VYLATLGSPAAHTARATFARNLVEIAGLATTTGPVDGFVASGADVAIVCSSNAVYAEQADEAIAALTAAGASRVYVAGREPVVAGGNALVALTELVELVGVSR
jgi:methylmalonyl-CoA mutase